MQVDPIKPTLKASGTKRLKLRQVELLLSFAFNLNFCRYTPGGGGVIALRARGWRFQGWAGLTRCGVARCPVGGVLEMPHL